MVDVGARTAAAAAFVLLSATLPALAQERPANVASGRKLVETHCSDCHAIDRDGASSMPGAPPLRDLKQRYPLEALAEAMAEGMETAHPQMPVFTFTPDEIDDLLAYLGQLG